MKVKVKLFNPNCKFEFIKKGEWIDLRAAENHEFKTPFANPLSKGREVRDIEWDSQVINLGIGMKLPKGIEAHVAPRSSTYNNYKLLMVNSVGIIDSTYAGPNDQWKFQGLAFGNSTVSEGDRICQFRLELSQKATVWQKIKWFFTRKIEFEFVEDYDGVDRGGIGSTGVK